VCPTLNAFDNTGDSRATLLIVFDNSYRDGLRIQKGNTVNTLSAKMGTGGNNVPIIAFDGYNQSVTEDIYRALRIGIDSGDCIAIPIQDGREMEKKQNGFGIGNEGDPSYTLDQTGAQSVAAEQGEESTMQVRRLTPVECERLMGWADNHTLPRADGKQNADTTRYKMCGNGVASPVAQWIGQHLMAIMNDA
jgi:DNA (cytosine-5)-methyltransferase 1